MDGHYLNNHALNSFVGWFNEAVKSSNREACITAHVDQFFGKQKIDIKELVSLFAHAITLLEGEGLIDSLKAILVIPLGDSERIEFFDESTLAQIPFHNEPPSIYFVDRETDKAFERSEEYKKTICVPFSVPASTVSYYRCFRSGDAFDNLWEFTKCLYLEHYLEQV